MDSLSLPAVLPQLFPKFSLGSTYLSGMVTVDPIFAERENKVSKPLLHFQFQAYLLKTRCVPGALQVEVGGSLEKPLGALWEAGACAEQRVLPWAGGSREGGLQLG